ncbi:MAG: glycogen debranching enzyme GlgX [Acidimicrobiales bacterium]|nr:glycogen debranching enzyme GlgX [Acidimicrobiales bacterium]
MMGGMARRTDVWPGRPDPLGATWDGEGTNFALFSESAASVDLCLLAGGRETRVPLTECTGFVWHGYVPGIGPGQHYGYRVHGPYEPAAGLRFNPNKLLLDPYARAIDRVSDWNDAVFGYDDAAGSDGEERPSTTDSGPHVPWSVVVDTSYPWGYDHAPNTPWADTLIYETHVKGMTMRHPGVPEHLRGTYAGLASPVILDHLTELGVTAVELLPVHHFFSEPPLVGRGLRNYWGYNTIGYFAPHGGYSSGGRRGEQVREFKSMVRTLHAAGIEVILDVVYNHTAEGSHLGPTLCFRGIDNRAYYRLDEADPSRYVDYTGTGNTLNVRNPEVLRLIMDSLRYWVTEMHVDGFRFDLAAALARGFHDVDRLSSFFDLIHQDPVISRVKLIAEPWDLGEGGYQVGNFPVLWTEWNGKYRDAVRDFWRGRESGLAEMGYRLTGSSDLYQDDGRRPNASINFVTAHDGFPLADLVSYERKHNEANGEANADGTDDNRSWNCGVEGPTRDPAALALRGRQQRNFLTTLLLSQGVPMLLAGDEIGRTQGGNNNAYCQDNETSWFDWTLDEGKESLLEFTRSVIRLRRQHPVFRRRHFFQGRAIHGGDRADIGWFGPDGHAMTEDEWGSSQVRVLGMFLNGEGIAEPGPRGERVVDDSFLVLLNSEREPTDVRLPDGEWAQAYEVVIDTSGRYPGSLTEPDGLKLTADDVLPMEGPSVVVLRRTA